MLSKSNKGCCGYFRHLKREMRDAEFIMQKDAEDNLNTIKRSKDAGCIRETLKMELPGKRKRRRNKEGGGWRDRGRCKGREEMERDHPARRPLAGTTGSRERIDGRKTGIGEYGGTGGRTMARVYIYVCVFT